MKVLPHTHTYTHTNVHPLTTQHTQTYTHTHTHTHTHTRTHTCRLFLEKLPKQYADYNKPEYKPERAKIKKLVKEAFPRAEQLKKQLLTQYVADKEALEAKLAEEVSHVYIYTTMMPLYVLPNVVTSSTCTCVVQKAHIHEQLCRLP